MNINEVNRWAKSKGLSVKKQDEGYVWFGEGVEAGVPTSIEEVTKAIFNRATNDKFVEYQKAYIEKKQ